MRPRPQLHGQLESFPDPRRVPGRGPALMGGDLNSARLIGAYARGYFPWYGEDDPLLWWHPDPRFVLFPDELRISKSMRPYLNQPKYEFRFDTNFLGVINQCRKTYRPRQKSSRSWIDDDMTEAYSELHELGLAHSAEAWMGGQLVGGLYGVALGDVFFGESMFSAAKNSSKFALIRLVERLKGEGYRVIDCQQRTNHLASLGGILVSREQFLEYLPTKIDDIWRDAGPWTTK
ncbi:MAG: leucyl/phenylalanyl-tRNA--protein transferase [Bacteroidota bacterium]